MNTSFAELKRSRKTVYDKIVSETNKMQSGAAVEPIHVSGNLRSIRLGTVMPLSGSFLLLRVRTFLGYVCSLMVSKDQVAGTLRTR